MIYQTFEFDYHHDLLWLEHHLSQSDVPSSDYEIDWKTKQLHVETTHRYLPAIERVVADNYGHRPSEAI